MGQAGFGGSRLPDALSATVARVMGEAQPRSPSHWCDSEHQGSSIPRATIWSRGQGPNERRRSTKTQWATSGGDQRRGRGGQPPTNGTWSDPRGTRARPAAL